jgi:hypothetical protein
MQLTEFILPKLSIIQRNFSKNKMFLATNYLMR